ncbi:terpenoid cyclases/protein prenyltransferase alpha-alpha toroid [Jimgerdemannia flammicorona]|uniref:Terpenoid cyclases/protein prenyltransferase alpha-alpha toroid n=1 Tax=Jimgerdemannia flammicorona TaxID=994334 RepID=A0A433Q939_9FUNG|nr:terpenoid cyclases/protein prenyltransferase alpha-alpha toroid [Jimgerdemannia flammicorona]
MTSHSANSTHTQVSSHQDKDRAQNFASDFSFKKHVAYFKRSLSMLPYNYTETDTSRMTLAFFCLSGLELLGVLDEEISAADKQDYVDWIYAQQILPDTADPSLNELHCGFRGSSWPGRPFEPNATHTTYQSYDSGNLANTYSALANLILLGDDLSRVNRDAIVNTMRHLQQKDGSFVPTYGSMESDLRFVYAACIISYILNDWRGVDIPKAVDYIRRTQTYEFGIAQSPGEEAHGGSTFCGIAALALTGKFDEGLVSRKDTIYWILSRQLDGFQGRSNKPSDTCYSFWLGGALELSIRQFGVQSRLSDDHPDNVRRVRQVARLPARPPPLLHGHRQPIADARARPTGSGSQGQHLQTGCRVFEDPNGVLERGACAAKVRKEVGLVVFVGHVRLCNAKYTLNIILVEGLYVFSPPPWPASIVWQYG